MQIQQTNPSDTKTELKISVDIETLVKHHNLVLRKLAKDIKVAGFRAGKAPLDLIEKQVDDNRLQSEVLDSAINETATDAINQKFIRSLGQPEVNVDKFVPKQALEYTLILNVLPEVKLPDYKKVKKAVPKVTVSTKDVDDVVNNLRERSAEKIEVKRASKDGDELIINFKGSDVKGKPIAGGKGDNYPLKLGSDTFIPGFEAGLIGKKAGDHTKLDIDFPKDYQVKALAGMKAVFEVDIKAVNELKLPKADDDFAAKVGPFKSVDELKKDIKEQLTSQKTEEATNKLKDEIVEEIVGKTKFSLPDVLVNEQIKDLEQDMQQNIISRGMTVEEYIDQEGHKTLEEWREKVLKPEAERRVKIGVILSEIAAKEKIDVTPEELEERLKIMRMQYSDPKVAGQFEDLGVRREIVSRMATEKTVNLLYQSATA